MPKLVYFPLQGRAQAIRYMLGAKGVQFEDVQHTFEEWGAIKAANTYGEGTQLPCWVQDDGTVLSQSMAILKMLAVEHGYWPTTAKAAYQVGWMEGLIGDVIEKPTQYAFMKDDATEEERAACTEGLLKFLTKLDAQWADGRAHAAGDQVTYADFAVLAFVTS